jgi:cation diffusion facilitator CzcD-associated flavoprotein CzcO
MDPSNNKNSNVRVVNFSNIDLPWIHRLHLDLEDLASTVRNIRRYADLPYVYVVAKDKVKQIPALLSELKTIRSPCYPYALFAVDGADIDIDVPDLDVVTLEDADPEIIRKCIDDYARTRFQFDESKLRIGSRGPLPARVDVAVVGAGVTGLYAAKRLREAGISASILEKRDKIGGIWSLYANRTSQVNSSECAYRLFERKNRSNRDHSSTREILEDIAQLAGHVSEDLFLETEVKNIEKTEDGYRLRLQGRGGESILESKGVILAINDRVGEPRKADWPNQAKFQGTIVTGISDDTLGIEWRNKDVVIVGMGAFAVENARTALEGGANHVTVLCRRHGTVCPKIIDYLNFATPYDEAFKHDKKSNLRNMTYWKKLYDLSGATQPECWMGKIKHEGHTISVSDIWFIGHYLKKIETITGGISSLTEGGVVTDGGRHIQADIVVNCIGFERNASAVAALSGYSHMYNNNYLDKDFIYLADAFIDNNAFNSLFGSSVLEMVKFYMEIYIMFFGKADYHEMVNTEGIEKVPVRDRKWSHYIQGAMSLIRNYPGIRRVAANQVSRRTKNFLEVHDLETFIAENKREWIDTHAMLAGGPVAADMCLPYVFERLVPQRVDEYP